MGRRALSKKRGLADELQDIWSEDRRGSGERLKCREDVRGDAVGLSGSSSAMSERES